MAGGIMHFPSSKKRAHKPKSKSLVKKVKALSRVINRIRPENENWDYQLVNTATLSTTGNVYDVFTHMPQGEQLGERNEADIQLNSINFKLLLQASAGVAVATRVIVFTDKWSTSDEVPAVTDIIASTTPTMLGEISVEFSKRFKVHYDRIITQVIGTENAMKIVNITKRFKRHRIEFPGNPGNPASLGAMYMLLISTGDVVADVTQRVKFLNC